MDEELINRIVNLKLDIARKLVNRMPAKMSSEFKEMGRIILKSVNENVREMQDPSSEKSKSSDQLNHVPIE